jgi:hypothetical protein
VTAALPAVTRKNRELPIAPAAPSEPGKTFATALTPDDQHIQKTFKNLLPISQKIPKALKRHRAG